jgi:hypothetical protein
MQTWRRWTAAWPATKEALSWAEWYAWHQRTQPEEQRDESRFIAWADLHIVRPRSRGGDHATLATSLIVVPLPMIRAPTSACTLDSPHYWVSPASARETARSAPMYHQAENVSLGGITCQAGPYPSPSGKSPASAACFRTGGGTGGRHTR